ncbi:MAG: hypothetical protein QXG39_03450 [Candidatus Aenigmatarchaeota archaeon]
MTRRIEIIKGKYSLDEIADLIDTLMDEGEKYVFTQNYAILKNGDNSFNVYVKAWKVTIKEVEDEGDK